MTLKKTDLRDFELNYDLIYLTLNQISNCLCISMRCFSSACCKWSTCGFIFFSSATSLWYFRFSTSIWRRKSSSLLSSASSLWPVAFRTAICCAKWEHSPYKNCVELETLPVWKFQNWISVIFNCNFDFIRKIWMRKQKFNNMKFQPWYMYIKFA